MNDEIRVINQQVERSYMEETCEKNNSFQGDHLGRNHSKNDSLLGIIYDKNRIIEKLQRQLHFQKLQLKFYLGKSFQNERIIEFSNNCNPLSVEENIPITFAVNRFCVQLGIKSKLHVLYERMCRIDGRINNLLRIQECLLRRVVEKMCEIVRKEKGSTMQIQIRNMMSKPEYMHLFKNILNASIGLKKNLDTFRICCDRLLIVEEERNSIAEQVYSLPIEQRTNCHYLIGIQIERVQLQNRLKDIVKDQSVLRKRIEQLGEIEGELKNLQKEYKKANKNCTEHMTYMLKRINSEALGLITKSNQQKEKYTSEIVKLKCENQRILKIVEKLRASIQDKEFTKDSMKLDSIFSAGFYQSLDHEINQAIRENEMNKDARIEKANVECRELSKKLKIVHNENKYLEKELDNLRTEYAEAKRQWEDNLEAALQERDEYKAQVEDLQAIRAAYVQLVDSRANMTEEGEKKNAGSSNKELEKDNLKLKNEVTLLTEETNKQKTKIRRLSEQILNFSGDNQKILGIEQLETKDVGSGDVGNVEDSSIPKTNSCNICGKNSDLERNIILQELQKSNVSEEDIQKLVQDQKLDEITTNIINDVTQISNECQCTIFSNSCLDNLKYNCDQLNHSTESKILSNHEKSPITYGDVNTETSNINVKMHPPTKIHIDKCIGADKVDKECDIIDIKDYSSIYSSTKYTTSIKIGKNSNLSSEKQEKSEQSCSMEIIRNEVAPLKSMIQFQDIKQSQNSFKNEEVKALKITYRNPKECRSITDSDPTTEYQSSSTHNCNQMSKKEDGKRLVSMEAQI